MDILKARKKAAEQKRSKKKARQAGPLEAPIEQGATLTPAEVTAMPAATEDVAALPAPATESPADVSAIGDEKHEADAQEIDLLSFRLAGEAYALEVNDVREVLKIRSLTPVPNAPSYILGVTALRGAVLPVIDLCVRFGLAAGTRDAKSRIIVVSSREEEVGLVVDRVTGVLRVAPDEIKPTPENIEQGAAFLRGIVRRDEKLHILLDLEKSVGA
jgi:purine-binding chemotaxis protein CheW